ncbi:MAG: hypothetical protein DRJ63_06035 [Thermoprotei archaeon]|nr:MAG: hypothetical protein DRJ63_06035 [Thermoprotei archaeon]
MALKEVAEELGFDEKELEKKALRAFIISELRRVKAEKACILLRYKKYGVKSISDLFKLIEKDIISDVDVHDDLIKLDYLEHVEKKLIDLLKNLKLE